MPNQHWRLRRIALPLLVAAGLACAAPALAQAQTLTVDCGAGQTIEGGLAQGTPGVPLTLLITGTCTENVTSTKDDVTFQGNPTATVNAADATRAVFTLDGARRNRFANLTILGGTGGIVGTRGSTYELMNCTVDGSTRFGVVSSYGSTASITGCTVRNVTGDGVVAANDSSLVITTSTSSGVFVRAGAIRIGDPGFGLSAVNTISNNGLSGEPGARGGVFAFQGGVIETRAAVISSNTGGGTLAFEEGIIEIRAGTVISSNLAAPGQGTDTFEGGSGMVASFRSTLRLRDAGTAVQGNAAHGVLLFSGSAVDFRSPPPVAVNGNAGFGLQCFGSEASFSGNTSGIVGNTLGDVSANCTGF